MTITKDHITIKPSARPIGYCQTGDGQVPAHFFPATGFTFGCYRQMLTRLSPTLRLTGMDIRPTWPDIGPPPENHNWNIYLDDLIAFLDAFDAGPVIGIGHSLGGITTVRAAVKRPDLFSAIILLEPALYPANWIRISSLIPWRYKSKHPQIATALTRQDVWDNRQAALNDLKGKHMFARFSPEALRDFADHALVDNDDGSCRLMFRKDWEARIYGEPPQFWKELKQVPHPVLGIKGKNSNAFLERQWQKWKKLRPVDTHHYVDAATHLLPLERPEETAAIVNDWLKAVL